MGTGAAISVESKGTEEWEERMEKMVRQIDEPDDEIEWASAR